MRLQALYSTVKRLPSRQAVREFRFALDDLPLSTELLGADQLARQARLIAASHQLETRGGPERLLDGLRQDEEVIVRSHHTVAQAVARGRRVTPAAEWLLDNYYLIEDQIHLA